MTNQTCLCMLLVSFALDTMNWCISTVFGLSQAHGNVPVLCSMRLIVNIVSQISSFRQHSMAAKKEESKENDDDDDIVKKPNRNNVNNGLRRRHTAQNNTSSSQPQSNDPITTEEPSESNNESQSIPSISISARSIQCIQSVLSFLINQCHDFLLFLYVCTPFPSQQQTHSMYSTQSADCSEYSIEFIFGRCIFGTLHWILSPILPSTLCNFRLRYRTVIWLLTLSLCFLSFDRFIILGRPLQLFPSNRRYYRRRRAPAPRLAGVDHKYYNIPCLNTAEDCNEWAAAGECRNNRLWMREYCALACNSCHRQKDDFKQHFCANDIYGDAVQCAEWAKMGECEKNSDFMLEHCAKACNVKDLCRHNINIALQYYS